MMVHLKLPAILITQEKKKDYGPIIMQPGK